MKCLALLLLLGSCQVGEKKVYPVEKPIDFEGIEIGEPILKMGQYDWVHGKVEVINRSSLHFENLSLKIIYYDKTDKLEVGRDDAFVLDFYPKSKQFAIFMSGNCENCDSTKISIDTVFTRLKKTN